MHYFLHESFKIFRYFLNVIPMLHGQRLAYSYIPPHVSWPQGIWCFFYVLLSLSLFLFPKLAHADECWIFFRKIHIVVSGSNFSSEWSGFLPTLHAYWISQVPIQMEPHFLHLKHRRELRTFSSPRFIVKPIFTTLGTVKVLKVKMHLILPFLFIVNLLLSLIPRLLQAF